MTAPQDLANAAIVAYLKGVLNASAANFTILNGLLSADKSGPLVIVSAHQGREQVPYTGAYILDLAILVENVTSVEQGVDPTLPTSPVPYFQFLTGAVWGSFKGSGLGTQSKALCDAINTACAAASPAILFTAIDIREKAGRSIEREFEQDTVRDTYHFELTCAPSVLTP